jgi:hypothetical protein
LSSVASNRRHVERNEEGRVSKRQAQVWAGIDAGKGHHRAAVVDETGAIQLSKEEGRHRAR